MGGGVSHSGWGAPVWEGVSQYWSVCPNVGGCSPMWRVCPSVGGCSPMWRVSPSVGGFAPVWEGVSLYACGCEVWVFLSHVLMTDTQVHLCVHLIAGHFGHVAKAYVAKTS